MRRAALYLTLLVLGIFSSNLAAFEPDSTNKMELDVKLAILNIMAKDPTIEAWFENSAGYAVFPKVGKGGFIIGGAFGRGLVIVNEQVEGYTSLSQATIGFQIGGQGL